MRSFHALSLMTLASLCAMSALPALAQDAAYYYGGVAGGKARFGLEEEHLTADQVGSGLTITNLTHDRRDTAYRVFGGYQFNRNFALEGGFFKLGKSQFKATTSPAGTLDGEVRVQGISLDAVGTLPLADRFSLIGRVGTQYARVRDRFDGTGAAVASNPNPSKRSLNYKIGAGVQYAFSNAFLMRAEAENYRINDAMGNHAPINAVMVSLVFPFGSQAEPVRHARSDAGRFESAYVAQPAPEPAAEPVAPMAPTRVDVAPVAPVAPAAPVLRRVSFAAESLFDFDDAVVRPQGKQALDTFARDVGALKFDMITVVGHSDRLGTPAYNQALSVQRADSVKAYLVTSGHFDPAKVSSVGKGETEPVTQAGACAGEGRTAKRIECLQADRRVEIEVTGTR